MTEESENVIINNNNDNKYSNTDNKNNSHFCKKSLGIPMHPVSEIEIAELTKIIENAHRYLQIAFAEDLYLYCQSNNINFSELRESLNTKWNVNILEPLRRHWRTLFAKRYQDVLEIVKVDKKQNTNSSYGSRSGL